MGWRLDSPPTVYWVGCMLCSCRGQNKTFSCDVFSVCSVCSVCVVFCVCCVVLCSVCVVLCSVCVVCCVVTPLVPAEGYDPGLPAV